MSVDMFYYFVYKQTYSVCLAPVSGGENSYNCTYVVGRKIFGP